MLGPLAGTWFDEFAPLYHAGAHLGLDRDQVNAYEVWEFAAVLGRHLPAQADVEAPTDGFDPLAARMRAQREGRPAPAPPPSAPPAPGLTTLRPVKRQAG